jgi:site-specific DNA-methyltransferase (adenine-specific)
MLEIKKEFKELIPPLTNEEFKQLEDNCLAEGIRDKIITWNGFIIDGHNRYEIATRWSLDYQTESKTFKDEDDVILWMIDNQNGRRNLTDGWKYKLQQRKKEILLEKGELKKVVDGKNYRDKQLGVLSIVDNTPKHDTRKEIAKSLNWSTGKVAMADVVFKKATPELEEKVLNNEVTINQAYQEIKKEEKKAEYKEKVLEARIETEINESIKQGNSLEILETLEDGCIDIVLTDPPYGIDYVSNRSTDENAITKRGLLNDGKDEAFDLLDKTCEILQRKTAVNSHLYFFCSWSVFSKFEAIISKYFTIKTPIVWDKGNKGSGDLENDWGNQTEIIIYCVKGKKLINNRRGNLISVSRLHTSKMIHPTQKPNELIREILEVSFSEGDFVVDPFMGSGSTIKVCQELKVKCLGIELDKEMFNIANNYINGN